ncbi:MAG TPA: hypothetical protein VFT74_17865 [Isosphaeraceae bacterium]|nr:hypothetical protein [Isosphaeraceae bacterium]
MQNHRSYVKAMTLAAACGSKIALGPALLSQTRRWPSRRNWALAAMGEMLLDKMGVFPPRYRPSLLIPHSLAGAWVAHESLKEDGIDDPWSPMMGAAVAAGVAVGAPLVRMAAQRVLGVPDALLGVAEDGLTLSIASRNLDLSPHDLAGAARESVEGLRERAQPTLSAVGLG